MSVFWKKVRLDWTTVTILKLLGEGERRFSDFLEEGIPKTTLHRRLRYLTIVGLIGFRKESEADIKEYYLTESGRKILEKLLDVERIYDEEMKRKKGQSSVSKII